MKKIAIIAILLTAFTFSAKAQWFEFEENAAEDFTLGFNFGKIGYNFEGNHIDENIMDWGYGASFSLVGFYLDFMYQHPEHAFDKISQDVHEDNTALAINFGYKIPVLRWLRITPIVGYSNETYGETDCAHMETGNNSIFNKYTALARVNHFNYGVGLSLKPFGWLELGVVATAHAAYANLSVNFIGLNDF